MKRMLITLSAMALLEVGCARTLMQPATAPTGEEQAAPTPAATATTATGADAKPSAPLESSLFDGELDAQAAAHSRNPGDYVVYRFSGSFRKSPITLTERVVERKGTTLVVDVSLEEEGKSDKFRLRLKDAPNEPDEVLSVARFEGGVQKPFGVEAYDALMAKTVVPIDSNEALIASEQTKLSVGSTAFDCTRSAYRVRSGDVLATMTTLESSRFAWGDLGGKVVAGDGSVISRAGNRRFRRAWHGPEWHRRRAERRAVIERLGRLREVVAAKAASSRRATGTATRSSRREGDEQPPGDSGDYPTQASRSARAAPSGQSVSCLLAALRLLRWPIARSVGLRLRFGRFASLLGHALDELGARAPA